MYEYANVSDTKCLLLALNCTWNLCQRSKEKYSLVIGYISLHSELGMIVMTMWSLPGRPTAYTAIICWWCCQHWSNPPKLPCVLLHCPFCLWSTSQGVVSQLPAWRSVNLTQKQDLFKCKRLFSEALTGGGRGRLLTLKVHQYVVFHLYSQGAFKTVTEGEYFFCMATYTETFPHGILFDVRMADCTDVCECEINFTCLEECVLMCAGYLWESY